MEALEAGLDGVTEGAPPKSSSPRPPSRSKSFSSSPDLDSMA